MKLARPTPVIVVPLLAVALLSAGPALAAGCITPPGTEGDQFYNNTYHTMQFCNGTNW